MISHTSLEHFDNMKAKHGIKHRAFSKRWYFDKEQTEVNIENTDTKDER